MNALQIISKLEKLIGSGAEYRPIKIITLDAQHEGEIIVYWDTRKEIQEREEKENATINTRPNNK